MRVAKTARRKEFPTTAVSLDVVGHGRRCHLTGCHSCVSIVKMPRGINRQRKRNTLLLRLYCLLTRTRQVVYGLITFVSFFLLLCLRVNYLCTFLLIAVDKLGFYMYVFLIYVCLQKRCLRLICLSSTVHTCWIKISDVNKMFRHIELWSWRVR